MQEPEGSLGREDPLEKATASTPVLLPRQSYGQRGLLGCGPCGCRVGRDRVTERTACVQRELRMFLGCRLRNDFPPRGPALNLLDFTGGARAVPGPAVPRARPGPREAALRTPRPQRRRFFPSETDREPLGFLAGRQFPFSHHFSEAIYSPFNCPSFLQEA